MTDYGLDWMIQDPGSKYLKEREGLPKETEMARLFGRGQDLPALGAWHKSEVEGKKGSNSPLALPSLVLEVGSIRRQCIISYQEKKEGIVSRFFQLIHNPYTLANSQRRQR
jgi:hypothetical protein